MKMLAGVLFLRANAGGFYALLTKPRLRRTEKAVKKIHRARRLYRCRVGTAPRRTLVAEPVAARRLSPARPFDFPPGTSQPPTILRADRGQQRPTPEFGRTWLAPKGDTDGLADHFYALCLHGIRGYATLL